MAYGLVMSRSEAVQFQLEVWRFRQVKPRNVAGWMIQAIENNYEPPSTYVDDRKKQAEHQTIKAAQAAIQACAFCDSTGFRYIKSSKYPSGAMRQCSHDATLEAHYTDSLDSAKPTIGDTLEGPLRDKKPNMTKAPQKRI